MNGRTYRCVLCYRLGVPLFVVLNPCSAPGSLWQIFMEIRMYRVLVLLVSNIDITLCVIPLSKYVSGLGFQLVKKLILGLVEGQTNPYVQLTCCSTRGTRSLRLHNVNASSMKLNVQIFDMVFSPSHSLLLGKLRMIHSNDVNPGRRFLACLQLNGERCIYFDWVDPPMCQRAMMIIPGLLRVRNRMEADMMVLVQANRNLKNWQFSWSIFVLELVLVPENLALVLHYAELVLGLPCLVLH
ncbi:hypothetical protein Tco_0790656 [Tanacetum coccineum]